MFPAANVRICQALGVWISQSLCWARAGETVVDCLALSIQATGSNKLAGVLTLTADACLVIWAADVRPAALNASIVLTDLSDTTVGVNHTLHLGALHLGVTSVTRATGAICTVVHGLALSIGPTRCGACTWVQALTVYAGLCSWTIGI